MGGERTCMRIRAVATAALVALVNLGCTQEPGHEAASVTSPTPVRAAAAALQIQARPFRLCIGDVLCTTTATTSATPLPYSYVEGPAPAPWPGTRGVFPAFGWLVGTTVNSTIPASFFQGNRLAGADHGLVYEVTEVLERRDFPGRIELDLATNFPGASPARMVIVEQPGGSQEIQLDPPPEFASAVAVSLFSLESPEGEGLFGLGARKDRFNQRGQLRNVWTEQQNTGASAFRTFAGQDNIPGISDLDPENAAYADERATFPNGAQAAYWVEAFLIGSRGWGAWTRQTHFQRLDLAVDAPDRIRWSVVDAQRLELILAAGGIEQASQAYTDYWGRPPAPPEYVYQPWLGTLNQGEGEAAPNGQGYWGGQRARCEIEEFIAQSKQHDIPFGLIGVEGWQVLPLGHPDCQVDSLEQICAELPRDATSYAEDEHRFKDCRNAQGENFLDYVRGQGFSLTGYWNMFHTDPGCPGDVADACAGSAGVPQASQQAYYAARDQGLYVMNFITGQGHDVVTNRQGLSKIIDFTHPDAPTYWRQQLSRMWDLGIYAFMHDFGELTNEEMRFASGERLSIVHNKYAYEYHRAARLAADEYEALNPGAKIFFYGRAGMTGACGQTPGVFPGDESTTWDAGHGLPSIIPALLNLSLSGCNAFTTDIGGYLDLVTPRTSEELFIRWSQAAALMAIMRIHNSTGKGSVYPWTYAQEAGLSSRFDTIGIFRRYARLKLRLAEEVVHPLAQRAARTGEIGPVRPLILEDQSAAALAQDYQWLLGDDILVAPVIAPGVTEQTVYFPQGAAWQRVRVDGAGGFVPTGDAVYRGGTQAVVPVDIADIPIFLRR